MNRTYLRQLLLSTDRLLITAEGYASAMMDCLPLIATDKPIPGAFFFNAKPPTYQELSKFALKQLVNSLAVNSELERVTITDEFTSDELPEGTIAYHRVWGFITSSSSWYFSSKQFEQDLLAAEANPAIACHFLHINTPGGEAWYLDRLSETMRTLQKPIVGLIEKCCASAGYYIACHCQLLNALTQNEEIGCIGTMSEMYDFEEYYAKLGIKHFTVKSSHSDLKNKKYEDVRKSKPEQFIREVLDPLSEQFINEVRTCRSKFTDLPDDDPILRGETYDSSHSIENGLIDGTSTFPEAIVSAYQLGQEHIVNENMKKRALNLI